MLFMLSTDMFSRTHGLGHTVSDSRSRTHGLGHTVSDARSRTHGLLPNAFLLCISLFLQGCERITFPIFVKNRAQNIGHFEKSKFAFLCFCTFSIFDFCRKLFLEGKPTCTAESWPRKPPFVHAPFRLELPSPE